MVFQKGHKKYGGKKPGSKHRETLLKEERRTIFDAEMTQVFVEKIHAARPEYLLDQYLGKPIERHEVVISKELSEEDKELIRRLEELEKDNG